MKDQHVISLIRNEFRNVAYFEVILCFISAAVQGRSRPINLSWNTWAVIMMVTHLMSDVTSEGAGEGHTGDTDWELLRELRGVTDWKEGKWDNMKY